MAGDEDIHGDSELLAFNMFGDVLGLLQRKVRAAEHGKVHLAVTRLVAELLLEVLEVLIGDNDLALRLLAAESSLQRGRLGVKPTMWYMP